MLALCIAAAAFVIAVISSGNDGERLPPPAPDPRTHTASTTDQTKLLEQVAALAQGLSQLENATGRREVIDQPMIAQMVERALAARLAERTEQAVVSKTTTDSNAAALARVLAQDLAQTPFGPQRDELWQKLLKIGGVDEAVAWFEQMAAANPASPDAQTELGTAYIQKLLQATDEQQRIELGKKIDAQFDRALELQPDHWEARFRKAVGMTYGPALSGRQTEAISQFEQLVHQQADRLPAAGYSQTYLYLGRLYAQRGDAERARETWQQGLARHPQDAELQGMLRQ
ncbi:MAG: tetratricopeptide repeat protein [Planctomycetota bacterium]